MYRPLGIITAACLIMIGTSIADDESGDEALKNLIKVMRVEANQKRKAADGKEYPDSGKLSILSSIESASGKDDSALRNLDQSLGSVMAHFSQADVKEAALKVRDEIRRKEKEGEEARIAEIETLLARLKQTAKNAKNPSDMDAILGEIVKLRRTSSYRQSERGQEVYGMMESARQFATSWQDYLAAMKNNDVNAARQALGSLKSLERLDGMMPRSEILALDAQLTQSVDVTQIVMGIRSLDEIGAAIAKLQEGRRSYDSNTASNVISALSGIEQNYRDFKEGLPASVQLNNQSGNFSSPEIGGRIAELRSQFLKLVIPRYVGIADAVVAKDGESVVDFIDRLREEAKAAGNPSLALRLKDVERMLGRGSNYSSQDTTGVNAYTAGGNQEKAKQYELAVISYQQALKSGSDLVPAETIGQRLEAIKAAHPAAYAAGIERFLNPPMSRFEPPMPPGRGQGPSPTIVIPPPAKGSGEKQVEPAPKGSRQASPEH